jgi:DNA-directed RNA polymerase specialized sigma24 family protein
MEEIMEEPLITIIYKLADGKRIRIEVTSEVEDALEQSERQIRSQRRQDRRYLIYTGFIDEFDDQTMAAPHEDTADLLIRVDSYHQLYAALNKLSAIQRRRLEMCYLDGLTYRCIAEVENVSHNAVIKSVKQAIDILCKHLSN